MSPFKEPKPSPPTPTIVNAEGKPMVSYEKEISQHRVHFQRLGDDEMLQFSRDLRQWLRWFNIGTEKDWNEE